MAIILTEDISRELCETVFSELAKETLKITLPSGQTIPLFKQFHSYYRNRILRYSKEDTIIEMALIFEYSLQEIHKAKLYKEQLETLNKPESYFLTKVNNISDSGTNSGLNTDTISIASTAKNLSINRGDTGSSVINKSSIRSGNSAINEDFSEIESDWDKKDKKLEDSSKDRNLLDINIDSLDLDAITTGITLEEKKLLEESPRDDSENPEISYTNISLNKSIVNNKNSSISAGKNFYIAKDTNNTNKNSLTTGVFNKQLNSIQMEFSYNRLTIETLNTYITNFRDSFLNSFSSIFIPYWNGYAE